MVHRTALAALPPYRLTRALPALPLRTYRLLSDGLEAITGVGLPRAGNIANFMKHRILDISRARRELGYAPKISPPEAIRRMAEWYRAEGRERR